MMTAEQLKASILQLAMQGKLVEQRPEEGTGEELYKEIQADKKRLIKEGKIKKQKPFPEITENDIAYDIPLSWMWVRLGDIISITSGEGLTSNKMKKGTIPVYGGNGITGFHNEALVHEETVVIGRVGYYCGSVHVTETEAWVTDNAFITTYPKNSIDRGYLVYVLRSMNLGKDNNATAQPVVSGKKIYPKLFPLPPLAEQKRIVEKIEELMPFVEQYAAASTKLNMLNASFPEMMKKSILQEAVQGKLVPQDPNDEPASVLLKKIAEEKKRLIKEGKIKKQKPLPEITEDEIPFDIPESWEWVRFSQVINIEPNLVKPEEHQEKLQIAPDSIGKGNGVLLQKRTVKESGVKSPNHFFYKGQILYSKIRPALRKVVEAPSNGLCSADMYPLSTIMDNHFVIYYMLSDTFTSAVTANANRVKMPKVNQEELNNVLVPVPPLNEQKRIAKRLDILIPQLGYL